MSQDKEREAFEAWVNKQPEAQSMRKRWWCRQIDDGGYSCHEPDVMWRAWQARAALASQQAGKGEPFCYHHQLVLNDSSGIIDSDTNSQPTMEPWLSGCRVETIPLYASPPSREPLTELLIEAEFGSDSNESYPDFLAGVRFAERAHGIHSREGGSNG